MIHVCMWHQRPVMCFVDVGMQHECAGPSAVCAAFACLPVIRPTLPGCHQLIS
ncbi:hypothetical protein BDA96_09G265900 [Sorghum bicolor]|uniref:Uncharacterized protein n=1 Tax=Sorghum bicolor TaxID=4558 RepID=A0A921QFE4_SORBI|nr:hypothetical protein BDA96_09G265900 [Sorghum bicolor]